MKKKEHVPALGCLRDFFSTGIRDLKVNTPSAAVRPGFHGVHYDTFSNGKVENDAYQRFEWLAIPAQVRESCTSIPHVFLMVISQVDNILDDHVFQRRMLAAVRADHCHPSRPSGGSFPLAKHFTTVTVISDTREYRPNFVCLSNRVSHFLSRDGKLFFGTTAMKMARGLPDLLQR